MSTLLTHLFAGRTLACVCLTILMLYFYHLYSEASVSVLDQQTQIDRLLQQQDSLRAQLQGGWRKWIFNVSNFFQSFTNTKLGWRRPLKSAKQAMHN
jgi:hypothetical protein